jgi:hypothetical protein
MDPQGRLYFGDVEANTIWRLDGNGRLKAVVTGKHSHSLYLTDDGSLYGEHVYYDNARQQFITSILKLSPDGRLSDVMLPTASPARGEGIFMDKEGNTYSVEGGAAASREVILLKRAPDRTITRLAGGERGHADGPVFLLIFIGWTLRRAASTNRLRGQAAARRDLSNDG